MSLVTSTGRMRRRHLANKVAALVCLALSLLALYPLFSVLQIVTSRGWAAVNWDFLTTVPKLTFTPGGFVRSGGIQHGLVGSFMVVGIGTLFGAPLGMLAGIHLSEARPSRFTTLVRVGADAMAGIPSIVAGLFGYALIVGQVGSGIHVGGHEVMVGLGQGYSAWAGGVALAVLMIPTVTRTTEEAMQTVPQSYREASLALGAPRWFTVLRVVLPAAWGAVATGLLLAIARIAGETAPLLITAGTSGTFLNTDPSQQTTTMPFVIYDYYKQRGELEAQAWGAALVLIAFILALNLAVRLASRRRMPA